MRLLSYNIHKGVGNDRRYSLDRVANVIAAEEPDVVCLQEVDFNVRRSRFDNQAAILADTLGETGRHTEYQLNVPRRDGGYGNLILSRWPLHTVRDVCLKFGNFRKRAAQFVVVDGPLGSTRIVNWHLGLFGTERRWQVEKLLGEEWEQHSRNDLPSVVVGDTNDWRNQLHDRFAADGFHQATNPVHEFRSFPSFLPVTSLDKAFLRDLSAEARIVRTPLSQRASDHLPLVLDIAPPEVESDAE